MQAISISPNPVVATKPAVGAIAMSGHESSDEASFGQVLARQLRSQTQAAATVKDGNRQPAAEQSDTSALTVVATVASQQSRVPNKPTSTVSRASKDAQKLVARQRADAAPMANVKAATTVGVNALSVPGPLANNMTAPLPPVSGDNENAIGATEDVTSEASGSTAGVAEAAASIDGAQSVPTQGPSEADGPITSAGGYVTQTADGVTDIAPLPAMAQVSAQPQHDLPFVGDLRVPGLTAPSNGGLRGANEPEASTSAANQADAPARQQSAALPAANYAGVVPPAKGVSTRPNQEVSQSNTQKNPLPNSIVAINSVTVESNPAKKAAAPAMSGDAPAPGTLQGSTLAIGKSFRQPVSKANGTGNQTKSQVALKNAAVVDTPRVTTALPTPARTSARPLSPGAPRPVASTSPSPHVAAAPTPKTSASAANNQQQNGSDGSDGEPESNFAPAASATPSKAATTATPPMPIANMAALSGAQNSDATAASPISITSNPASPIVAGGTSATNVPAHASAPDSDATNAPQSLPRAEANQAATINTAQLSGDSGHSEIHIAMQADRLGQVELHARITGEQVGAAITVDKKEAHAALAVELPSLQQALSEKQLRVEQVVLAQSPMHASADSPGNSPGQQPGGHPTTASKMQTSSSADAISQMIASPAESAMIFDERGRLSVHA